MLTVHHLWIQYIQHDWLSLTLSVRLDGGEGVEAVDDVNGLVLVVGENSLGMGHRIAVVGTTVRRRTVTK
jgi:hypothetical protein